VTLEAGKVHRANLICERFYREEPKDNAERIEKELDQAGFKGVQLTFNERLGLKWHDDARINYGWIERLHWRDQLLRLYGAEACRQVDLDRAIVSADTELRLLRYIFPRRGAQTLRVEHVDEPGALDCLGRAIANCGMNVLSAVLRRGGTRRRRAELVAVCEPKDGEVQMSEIHARVQNEAETISRQYRARCRLVPDRDASSVIYPNQPHAVVAEVPRQLRPVLDSLERLWGHDDGDRVFFSRRYIDGHHRDQVVSRVADVVSKHGCSIVEARPGPNEPDPTPHQVQAKMWKSRAAIVLVAKESESDEGFSANLAHEYGFFQGQGKPVLFLVQERCMPEMEARLSNHKGLFVARFPDDDTALNPGRPDSLDRLVSEWIATWKK